MARFCVDVKLSDLVDDITESVVDYIVDYFDLESDELVYGEVEKIVKNALKELGSVVAKSKLYSIVYNAASKAVEDTIKKLKQQKVIK